MLKAILNDLRDLYDNLDKTIATIEKNVEKAPAGTVILQRQNNATKYYVRENPSDGNGRYLPKKDISLAKQLVQKQYDKKYLKLAKKERDAIGEFLNKTHPNEVENCYSQLCDGRKVLIKPYEMSDEDYVNHWMGIPYEKKAFSEDAPEYYTRKGERVRSKSEVIIADMLDKFNVPYKYECPIVINGKTIHPDFTVLAKRKRKVMFWEHLGRMGDMDYAINALRRNNDYQASGYFPGTDIIYSYETAAMVLSTKQIEILIKEYLL